MHTDQENRIFAEFQALGRKIGALFSHTPDGGAGVIKDVEGGIHAALSSLKADIAEIRDAILGARLSSDQTRAGVAAVSERLAKIEARLPGAVTSGGGSPSGSGGASGSAGGSGGASSVGGSAGGSSSSPVGSGGASPDSASG